MPDARRKRGQRAMTRRRLAIAGIAAFVLVDLGLVALAVTREPSGLASEAGDATLPTASVAPPEASESATPTPSPTVEAAAVPVTRHLSAVDGQTAWRADTGACTPGSAATPLTLEVSTTGGSSWVASTVTTPGAVAGVDRLQASDASTAFVVGPAGEDCSTAFTQTFSAGAAFRDYPDRLPSAWYVARSNQAVVHSPSGDRTAPCPVVVDLAVVSDSQAAVLCADRTLYRTADAAASWDAGTVVPGAVALTVDAGTFVVASVGVDGCEGTQVASTASAADAVVTPTGCSPVTSAEPGQVAVSAAAGSVWLWAGDDLAVSSDAGVTW